ncbi:hypothetical protein OESDEN_10089 [Oesophagostomum dentatum]|nr:hypothetical protein OESDEN_10089 [Oesophagostomum dentatum]
MIANVTELSERVRGTSLAITVNELISVLKSISPADVEMLADPYRALDNELIDNVLVANNIVK